MKEKRENAYLDYDNSVKCCITNGHCIREIGETCEGCKEKEENNGKRIKEKLAETILYWIASERENEVYADENYCYEKYPDGRSENRYYLYTGNINYLIDFTSAYNGFIQDMIDNVKEKCKVEDIECIDVSKQEITLKINGIETRIYVDDEWLKISFEGERVCISQEKERK